MLKKTTSLTLAFTGLVVLLTSIVLYIGPPGHVGHFSPWSFMGLSKHYWGVLHLNSGILFCAALLIHVYYNWKLLFSYMKWKKSRASNYGLAPLAFSFLLTVFVCVGACYEVSPMKQIMNYARGLKMSLVQKYGSPPYGASMSYPVATIAGYMGWDVNSAFKRLHANNIVVDSPQQPLMEVARNNHTTIGHLLDIMNTNRHGGINP